MIGCDVIHRRPLGCYARNEFRLHQNAKISSSINITCMVVSVSILSYSVLYDVKRAPLKFRYIYRSRPLCEVDRLSCAMNARADNLGCITPAAAIRLFVVQS